MSEWKTYKLGDLYSEPSRNGLTKPSAIRGSGYKMVNMKEIFAYDRMVNIPMERVPLTEKEERFILKSGDLLFARQSLVVSGAGKCSIFLHDDEDVVFESHLIRTRFDEKFVLPSFLYYYFRSPIGRNKIESIVEFTAAAGIRGSDLSNIEIEIPDLPTQKQIAQILSSLDDKIELNLQMNQTLEAMAQAIFKEWFVNFNYPKLSEHDLQDYGKDRIKNEKVKNPTNQINPDNPVQDKLVDGLPKGWRMGRVDELFVLQRGFDLPAITRNEGIFPVVAASGISTYHNDFKVTGPGVTTGRSGVLGNVFYISEDFWPLNTSLFIKEFKNSTPLFAYHFLQTLNLIQFNGGSAVPTLNRNDVHGIECIIPELEVIRRFEEFALSIFTKIDFNKSQIQSLTQTRDTLLPKLMSGQLKVLA